MVQSGSDSFIHDRLRIRSAEAQASRLSQLLIGRRGSGQIVRHLMYFNFLSNVFFGGAVIAFEGLRILSSMQAIVILIFANIIGSLIWIRWLGYRFDVSENSRRGLERILTEIVDNSPALISVKDMKGHLILTNDEFEMIFRTEGQDQILNEAELMVLRSRERVQTEESVVIDGNKKTYLVNRFPLYDQSERLIAVCSVLNDITHRIGIEQELRRSEDAFRTLADTIPSIVWKADSDGRVEYFNRRWYEYTGLERHESLIFGWTKVIHEDDLESTRVAWELAMRRGKHLMVEHRMRRHDGRYRWHLVRGMPQRSSNGAIEQWFGSSTDIDDQKRISERLEKRVEERTRELVNANRELESFSYSVSHDLRAPLRSMDGFSQLLLDNYGSSLDPKGQTYLKRVRAASRTMAGLIDDLLMLSRISRAEIKRESGVDLSMIVLELIEEKRKLEPDRRIELIVHPHLYANCDSGLLRIALWNLVDNAWKYTSRTDRPRIEFGARSNEQGEMVFEISDNGVGFEMAHSDQLFKAFQRLHGANEFPGSGIGLATVQRVIERHGGRIWAEGSPGKGAAFRFVLESKGGTKGDTKGGEDEAQRFS